MILGRHDELERINQVRGGGVLVVRGPAGVGKSTLLGAVADSALTTSGVESEVELAFSGLHRLLMPLAERFELPPALKCALGVVSGDVTDLLVCTSVLDVLRKAAPVMVVVDDAQDVDRASMQALLFAARRLARDAVGMVFAVRDPDERTVDTAGLPQLQLAGLAKDSVARLLGIDTTTAAKLTEITGGNPLVLKEITPPEIRQALVTGKVPVSELFTTRLATLPAATRDALVVAAAEETGDLATIHAACAQLGLPAVTELPGLVTIVGAEVRFSHPLVRSAAYAVPSAQRREVHAAIADALLESPRKTRHRALATVQPDDGLASRLEQDADTASRRGGQASAVPALLESARLSQHEPDRRRRLAAAAHAAWKSGQPMVARQIGELPVRLRGLVELYGGDQVTAYEFLARTTDPDLLVMGVDAAIHAGRVDDAKALGRRIGGFAGYEQYGNWLAEDNPPAATPWQILAAAPRQVKDSGAHRWLLPMAISLRGGHLEQTREFGLAAVEDLSTRGMLAIYPIMLAWLAEVEVRIGLWDEACAHAEEGLHAARDIGHKARFADFESLLALIAAARGDRVGCVRHAELAMTCPLRNVLGIDQAKWAIGLMHLADADHELAAEYLTAIQHDHVKRAALADTVEALVRLGDLEQATRLNENHRSRALLSGDEKEFQLALENSLPFDRARTALLYGQWLRRERRIREAKTVLRLGHDLFTQLGARPWAERTGAEIRACGGITAPDGVLTPQEHEIASLATAGLSNREIGARLFLSHRTVAYHLHKIFRKTGVANRSQLRNRLATDGVPT